MWSERTAGRLFTSCGMDWTYFIYRYQDEIKKNGFLFSSIFMAGKCDISFNYEFNTPHM